MTQITLPIVGAHFRPPAKLLLAALPAAQPLWLIPEPTNEFDPNAIRVVLCGAELSQGTLDELDEQRNQFEGYGVDVDTIAEADWHLGYIPKEHAALLIRRLNSAIADRAQSEHNGPVGAWPCSFTFTLEGKPATQFDLP